MASYRQDLTMFPRERQRGAGRQKAGESAV